MAWTKEDGQRLAAAQGTVVPQKCGLLVAVKGSFDPFKSPVDGRLIESQRQLERHNKEHGVVDSREFTPEWYASKAAEREAAMTAKADRKERIEDIQKAIHTLQSKET